jgi:hypothetical protein
VTVVDNVNQHNHLKLSFYDPSDLHVNNANGKPAHLVFHADTIQKTNVEDSILVNIDPHHFSKALPSKIDYETLSPYFAYRPHDVVQHTLRQTTQLAKSTFHYLMRRHLISRFQMLRHERLNEVIATDTFFSSVKFIERYQCAQVFFGMTTKRLHVAGMKTESELPDVYLDFIRQCGISSAHLHICTSAHLHICTSALRRDNAKSETRQCVRQVHQDLVIADQWTEPHSPWQNPAELNGVKYLKSHAQVLLDRNEHQIKVHVFLMCYPKLS